MTSSVTYTVNTESEAYKRLTTAGFKIDGFAIGFNGQCHFLRGSMTCVCRKEEHFLLRSEQPFGEPYVSGNKVDVALALEDRDVVSGDHLKRDGYTDEEIAFIRRAYDPPSEYG